MTRKKYEPRGFKAFMVKKFAEQGETYMSYSKNTDYTRQAIQMVINGSVTSGRIRLDIAHFLGRKNWAELVNEFLKEQEEN